MPFLLFVFTITLDQASKYLVRQWGGFYICNEGIAFGIQFSKNWIWLFILLFLIILLILNFKFKILNEFINFKFRISNFGLIFILSGAISNIIDRLYFGCIIDFIRIPFWPAIFNLADVFITIGAVILLVKIFRIKK